MNVKFVFLIIFLVFFGEICMFKLSVLSMLVELFFDVMEMFLCLVIFVKVESIKVEVVLMFMVELLFFFVLVVLVIFLRLSLIVLFFIVFVRFVSFLLV